MSRYIDADKFEARINASPAFQNMGQDGFFLREIVLQILDGQPTADVVEVRHGEWKKVSEKYPRYAGSSCNHLYNNKEYKYCPECGAKMDGRREENER